MSSTDRYNDTSGIAIIGMAGRFPGAANIEEFWANLRDGIESVTFFTNEELEAAGVSAELANDPNYVKAGAVIEGEDLFDASFFGCSPREAEVMDPQHRLFLECAWEAFENAGYDPESYKGSISVFAGAGLDSYLLYKLAHNRELKESIGVFQILLGNDKNHLATRVSYKFNLRGPSINVQTSCSTSLVSVCLASQSLLSYESDMALAGGVRINVPQKTGYIYKPGGIASPDGHCRAFDSRAQGTLAGSGAGAVVLKRLEDALADGDYIHAVIKGTALNNDGSAKVGYTAPSIQGQSQVIAAAQALAGVQAESITYIEAHGTGTNLGDPIEIAALKQAFSSSTTKKGFCAIGSLKTNIGHLDAAAGVASLIKTVEAIKHKQLPPSLHFEIPNPEIDFEDSPFFVNTQLTEWKTNAIPRRAGVSAFGIGGTNAHVIIEEAPEIESSVSNRNYNLLLLSALTRPALDTLTMNLLDYLKEHPEINLADVAYTLQLGRKRFDHSRAIVCSSVDEAFRIVERDDSEHVFTDNHGKSSAEVAFMFSGQGAQHVNMSLGLYKNEPVFARHLDECAERLTPHLGFDLREVLYPSPEKADQAAELLNQTFLTQPALFSVEYALAKLLMEYGIQPVALIGHSIGEYVAACIAEVFTLDEALALVAARGRLMQQLPAGAMLVVPLPYEDVKQLIDDDVSLAAANAPSLHVVSGTIPAIEELENRLMDTGIGCRRLFTSHAFHSHMMAPILDAFAEEINKVRLKWPKLPYLSNVTGKWITASEATEPDYWVRHLRQPVLFQAGLEELLKSRIGTLIEVGPGQTLATLVKKNLNGSSDMGVVHLMRKPNADEADEQTLLCALGKLWTKGARVDWKKFYGDQERRRVPLPTYPFERKRYWIDTQDKVNFHAGHLASLKPKPDIADWFYIPSWKRSAPARITEHQDNDTPSRYCIFVDDAGLGTGVSSQLAAESRNVISVSAGERFSKLDEKRYTINPARREDYDALLADLNSHNGLPEKILHLWSVTADAAMDTDGVERAQQLGFYSLMFLAQAIGDVNITKKIEIIVVTSNLYEVLGHEAVNPLKSTVIGPCKVIPKEYPDITCRNVDILLPEMQSRARENLVRQLIEESESSSSELVVALRNNHRWVQQFEAIKFQVEQDAPALLRDRGVYLITGGMGGIGLGLAQHLAQCVKARIALIGRSDFPNREEWDNWIAINGSTDAISKKILKIRELEALGSEVMIFSADVSDHQRMHEVAASIKERYATINGVIHLAGLPASGMMQLKTPEMAANVLAPKVKGTLVLEQVLEDCQLDFFAMFSSLSSLTGLPGRSDYCAANAFLDAFAHHYYSKKGVQSISINWDGWREVGMGAALANNQSDEPQDVLENGMSTAQGVDAFIRALSCSLPQVIVSLRDLQSWLARSNELTATTPPPSRKELSLRSAHPRPNLANDYIAPTNAVEETLADIWQRLLGIACIGIHDNFFELGGDSVISIQIIAKANQAGIKLTPRQVFEHTTIAELACVAGTSTLIHAEQGIVTGSAPLTPIQLRFLEIGFADPHHFNQAIMFEVREKMNWRALESAVNHLIRHHDALRLALVREENRDWEQFYSTPDHLRPFARIDLSQIPHSQHVWAIESIAAQLQIGLDPTGGEMLKVAFLDLGPDEPARLIIIIHHLVVDAISWRFIIEDLQTAYDQLVNLSTVKLPAKTTSFKQWAVRLSQYAESGALDAELNYWLAQERSTVQSLPTDHQLGENDEASIETVSSSLSQEETRAILQDVPLAFRTQINDVLLAATLEAFASWTGERRLLVDLEGHGREAVIEDVDISRTVGWFTTIFPVLLSAGESAAEIEVLQAVKQQLRAIPNRGMGYGLLRYLGSDAEKVEKLLALPEAEISFLYLGQFDQAQSQASTFARAKESSGHPRSPRARRKHLIEISGSVGSGQLHMSWTYSRNLHAQSTIETLAAQFTKSLQSFISHSQSPGNGNYSASDFVEFGWSQQDLDDILAQINQSTETR